MTPEPRPLDWSALAVLAVRALFLASMATTGHPLILTYVALDGFACGLAIYNLWTTRPTATTPLPLIYLAAYLFRPTATPSEFGLFLVAVILPLKAWTHLALWTSYSTGHPTWKTLRADGPYRYVRHPQYATGAAARLACALAFPDPVNLASAAVYVALQVLAVRHEERFLATQPAWLDYAQRVRYRLCPALW